MITDFETICDRYRAEAAEFRMEMEIAMASLLDWPGPG